MKVAANKYVCRDCDFIFYLGTWKLKKNPFCPKCGENIATEKCDIHRRYWTTKEVDLIDKVIKGELSKTHVAQMTGRTYEAVQRAYEKRIKV